MSQYGRNISCVRWCKALICNIGEHSQRIASAANGSCRHAGISDESTTGFVTVVYNGLAPGVKKMVVITKVVHAVRPHYLVPQPSHRFKLCDGKKKIIINIE